MSTHLYQQTPLHCFTWFLKRQHVSEVRLLAPASQHHTVNVTAITVCFTHRASGMVVKLVPLEQSTEASMYTAGLASDNQQCTAELRYKQAATIPAEVSIPAWQLVNLLQDAFQDGLVYCMDVLLIVFCGERCCSSYTDKHYRHLTKDLGGVVLQV